MSPYIKAISAVIGGISTWGITAAASDGVNAVEWFGLLGVLSTSLAVFAFPNAPVPEP
jgi:hypothetical protein